MGHERSYSTREIVKVLKRLGFVEYHGRGKGSHRWFIFEHDGRIIARTMLPSGRNDIHPDTFQNILGSLHLNKLQFEEAAAGRLDSATYTRIITRES